MMSWLLALTLAAALPAAKPRCDKTSCDARERDLNGGCCPVPKCPEGQSVRQGTDGHCCWVGQSYSGREHRCVGAPACPDGYNRHGATCLTRVASPEGGVGLFGSEITVGQYRECVNVGRCTPPDGLQDCNWPFLERAVHPVNCVDYRQAADYCAYVDARLPTIEEWLDVATHGGTSLTPWGGGAVDCEHAVQRRDGRGCGRGSTAPACSLAAGQSPVGHCDLLGNVSEWTVSSPEGRPTWRSVLGGSWLTAHAEIQRVEPEASSPRTRSIDTGFRCYREPPRAGEKAEPAAPGVEKAESPQ